MKTILFHELPDTVIDTKEFNDCNLYGSIGNKEEKNEYDHAFEQMVGCTLRYNLGTDNWYLDFTDEEYTWFVLKWWA